MRRAIIHLDADAFFASVEQASDPRLRGKPVAVGGEQRGIVASASYEARKYGVYTPMPTVQARRLCPHLVVLPGDYEKYERFSRWMFSYAYDFTPEVEVGSIDEGYFDLTSTRKPPLEIARTIRDAIRQSLKISVSEGIGANKLVSQIASKLHKPAAFLEVPLGQEIPFLHPLPNVWLPGVGPHTGRRLDAAGLTLIQHVAATPPELLAMLVGRAAVGLRNFAQGIDERPVVPRSEPSKSYGQQETFAADTTDEEFVEAQLRRMADHLMSSARADGKSIRTLTVKVRYNDMAEDQAGESLLEPTDLETDVYPRLRVLFRQAWRRRVSLRMISLRFSNLYAGGCRVELPLDRRAERHDAERRLAGIIDDLRHQRGAHAVMRGHDLLLRLNETAPSYRTANRADRSPAPPAHSLEGRTAPPTAPPSAAGPWQAIRPRRGPWPRTPAAPTPARVPLPRRLPPRFRLPIPLAVHSFYSFLDSTLSLRALVDLAQRHELPAIALTDHANLHGAVEFFQTARQAGLRPILGATLRVHNRLLRLYVENANGYTNLCRLLTQLDQKPDFLPPNAQLSTLNQFNLQGLLAVSSAAELAAFFPGRFYREISGPDDLRRSIADGLPAVYCRPIRYAAPADRGKFEVVQSIRTRTLLRQAHPEKDLTGEFHFPAELELRPWLAPHPELVDHSFEIADRCRFELPLGQPQFPAFDPPDGSSPTVFLRQLVLGGLRRRYPDRYPQMLSQIEEELGIIRAVGYEEYFLVVWDLLQECRRRGIEWITRGSAADSLVCYCLGISDVCPIRFELYFRRFLNLERMQLNKLPDIDVDFPHDRKDEVIEMILAHYGAEHAAVVGGFSTYQARSAVGDVAKVLGVSEFQIRRLTERLPHVRPEALAEAITLRQECRDLPVAEEPYRTALQMAVFLDGFPRHPKMHPCGVVVSRAPLMSLTPCFTAHKGYPTTHFDMDAVEAVGLIKMDILAQGGLAVMRDVRQSLGERGITIDLAALEPWQDEKVWNLIRTGNARAVHHIESPAMVGLSARCDVSDIDGLIAIVSVIRPGAANENNKMEFARRYQGLSPIVYPHPSLEPCLRSTFGLIAYEEHVLQICEAFAGLPAGRADVLRRALGKSKSALIAEIEQEFRACARARKRDPEAIDRVWKLVSGFEGYAFCKAHSTAYGVEAYQSAWLKRYYPVDFMAAVLSNGKGFYPPLVYVLECHRLGIPLLPPWVNQPGPAFGVEHVPAAPRHHGLAIRVPATRVKGLTDRTQARMVQERARGEFASLPDFYRRVIPSNEEMESLIRVGAFDRFGQPRTRQFWDFQFLCRSFCDAAQPAQGWLMPPPGADRLPQAPLQEPDRAQRLDWETELLGFPVTGHPLELYPNIAWDTYCPVARLSQHRGETVVTCGLVVEQRIHHQVTGEPMKFLTLADWTGMVETELFAATYKSYGLATVRYPVLEVTGTVEPYENGRGFSLRIHTAGKPRRTAG
jgi:DNA-directed DNA polymerase III PolC